MYVELHDLHDLRVVETAANQDGSFTVIDSNGNALMTMDALRSVGNWQLEHPIYRSQENAPLEIALGGKGDEVQGRYVYGIIMQLLLTTNHSPINQSPTTCLPFKLSYRHIFTILSFADRTNAYDLPSS